MLLLSQHPISPPVRFNWMFHVSPVRLNQLAAAWRDAKSDGERAAVADEFSAAISDFKINGVWKVTRPGRLPLTEKAAVDGLPQLQDGEPLRVLDIGASDASTSVDLLAALERGGARSISITVADLNIRLHGFRAGPFVEYRTTDGTGVLFSAFRFGARLPRPVHWWDIPAHLLILLRKALPFGRWMKPFTSVELLTPAAQNESRIQPAELDLFKFQEELAGTMHLVRASNILNLGYFEPDQIQSAIGAITRYLQPGGRLIVSRSHQDADEEEEHGTVWKLTGTGLTVIDQFGDGSEVAHLIPANRPYET